MQEYAQRGQYSMQKRSSGSLNLRIGTLALANPVCVASGTFGYGSEYEELIDLDSVGALFAKSVTLKPRGGNDIPRLIETPSGLLNSIGLANVGIERYIREKLPIFNGLPCPVFANVAGDTEDDFIELAETLDPHDEIAGFEINLSCPNVKGGLAFGTDARQVESLTRRIRDRVRKPLVVKLTPNVTDVAEIAIAAEAGGADAVTCINTLIGMVIDTARKEPALRAGTGGLSGPGIRPVGVAVVYRVKRSVKIPIIGAGGIMSADDALQYMLAGASAIQVGTANFVDPNSVCEVLDGVTSYANLHGIETVEGFHELLGR